MSENKLKNHESSQLCHYLDISHVNLNASNISKKQSPPKGSFFTPFFEVVNCNDAKAKAFYSFFVRTSTSVCMLYEESKPANPSHPRPI